MAKKATPIITYKEILCLAIANLENQIAVYREKSQQVPEDHPIQETIHGLIEPLQRKQEAIKQLYEIESGVTYI